MTNQDTLFASNFGGLNDLESHEITPDGELIPFLPVEPLQENFDNESLSQSEHETIYSKPFLSDEITQSVSEDFVSSNFTQEEDLSEFTLAENDQELDQQEIIAQSEKDQSDFYYSDQSDEINTKKPNILIDSEKETYENRLSELISPYFYEEVTFLNQVTSKQFIQVKEIETIHQKLLFLIEQGVQLSEKTYMTLSYYYYMTFRNYEGIKLIEPKLETFEYKYFFCNLLANFYFNIEMKAQAKKYFIKTIKLNQSFIAPYFSLGYLYLQQNNHHKALKHLKIAEQDFLENRNFLLLMGQCYEIKEQMDQTLFYYEKYLSYEKDNDLLTKVADLSYKTGQFEKALSYFENLLELKITIKNLAYKKAVCYFFTGNKDSSLKQIAECLNDVSNSYESDTPIDLFNLFTKAYKVGIHDLFTPKVFESLLNELGLSYQEFLESEIHPEQIEDIEMLLALAKQSLQNKQYRATAKRLKQILKVKKKDPQALKELGKLYFNHSNVKEKGIKIFLFLEKKKKTDLEIDFYLGIYYFESQKWKKSIECLERAKDKNDLNYLLFEKLGESYLHLNNEPLAKTCFQQALGIEPNHSNTQIQLGQLYLKDREYQNGIKLFNEVLKQDNNNKEAHYHLSKAYKLVLEHESEEHYSKYVALI